MDSAHRPILDLALATLPETGAKVIDLGCGNGALLQKLCERNGNVIPYGVELEGDRFVHIRTLLPQFAENFVCGNLFEDERLWQGDRCYHLALLMPGRLLEVAPQQAEWLRQKLKQHCEQLLIYAYGDWLTRYGNLAGLAEQVGLRAGHPNSSEAQCTFAIVP
jgi:trans-aconitate methyltransferase